MHRRTLSATIIEPITESSEVVHALQPHTANMTAESRVGPDGDLIPLSPPRLIALTIALLGLQFCWAVQVGNVTGTLLTLGMSHSFVSYAWLAG